MDNQSGLGDVTTQIKLGNQNIASQFQALIAALQSVFPQVTAITVGSFTLGAASSLAVSQPLVTASSYIGWVPTNAAAATLTGSTKSLYLSARTAGTGFTVATGSGGAAAGTETFMYLLVNL